MFINSLCNSLNKLSVYEYMCVVCQSKSRRLLLLLSLKLKKLSANVAALTTAMARCSPVKVKYTDATVPSSSIAFCQQQHCNNNLLEDFVNKFLLQCSLFGAGPCNSKHESSSYLMSQRCTTDLYADQKSPSENFGRPIASASDSKSGGCPCSQQRRVLQPSSRTTASLWQLQETVLLLV
eukprot:1424020-Amphidinium_carterae.1